MTSCAQAQILKLRPLGTLQSFTKGVNKDLSKQSNKSRKEKKIVPVEDLGSSKRKAEVKSTETESECLQQQNIRKKEKKKNSTDEVPQSTRTDLPSLGNAQGVQQEVSEKKKKKKKISAGGHLQRTELEVSNENSKLVKEMQQGKQVEKSTKKKKNSSNDSLQGTKMETKVNTKLQEARLNVGRTKNTSKKDKDTTSTILSELQCCTKQKDLLQGMKIHADILKKGLLRVDIYIGSTLVNMYAKCGALSKAQEVFDALKVKTVVSWTALIAGYAKHGQEHKALECFESMKRNGFKPDAVTFVCILKAFANLGMIDKCKEIHKEIIKEEMLERGVFVGNTLVDMYANFGMLARARKVFEELHVRDVVSWNALITGYAQNSQGKEALLCFERMQCESHCPDLVTYVCILKACAGLGASDKARKIHSEIIELGLIIKDLMIGNALVDMYVKCDEVPKAKQVFDGLPARDIVSWNALISGYANHGHNEEALNCIVSMKCEGLSPNAVTFVCILKACSSLEATDHGREIHCEVVRQALLEKNVLVGNAVVDMYAKCGKISTAQEIFNQLRVRNLVSWTALISGYAQHGDCKEALNCYDRMRCECLSPDAVTFVCILQACGTMGLAGKGKSLHAAIIAAEVLGNNIILGNTLVDMYAKCGMMEKAEQVFKELPVKDIVSWNAVITGYAQLGKDAIVCANFDKLISKGVQPNLATFTVVLNACSHSGLTEKAQLYFETMTTSYGIIPTSEHYACMVDLFGRAGHLQKAAEMIKETPAGDYLPVWISILGACRKWKNVELARWAFENAIRLDGTDPAAYVCMSNIYTDLAMQDDAEKIEYLRVKNKA